MRWSIDNPGAHELIKAYEHYGQDIPAGLIAPVLRDIEHAFWTAFWELSTSRSRGEVAGPIPLLAILQYQNYHSFVDFNTFLSVIRLMDEVYLSHKKNEG